MTMSCSVPKACLKCVKKAPFSRLGAGNTQPLLVQLIHRVNHLVVSPQIIDCTGGNAGMLPEIFPWRLLQTETLGRGKPISHSIWEIVR